MATRLVGLVDDRWQAKTPLYRLPFLVGESCAAHHNHLGGRERRDVDAVDPCCGIRMRNAVGGRR